MISVCSSPVLLNSSLVSFPIDRGLSTLRRTAWLPCGRRSTAQSRRRRRRSSSVSATERPRMSTSNRSTTTGFSYCAPVPIVTRYGFARPRVQPRREGGHRPLPRISATCPPGPARCPHARSGTPCFGSPTDVRPVSPGSGRRPRAAHEDDTPGSLRADTFYGRPRPPEATPSPCFWTGFGRGAGHNRLRERAVLCVYGPGA